VPRALRYALIGLGVVGFLAISAGLARVLGAAAAERDAAIEIVKAESHGDRQQVIARIEGCRADPRCRNRVAVNVARLRSAGKVRVLRLDGPPRLAVSSRVGTARIVWRAGDALPVVQCVKLRRRGDVLEGFRVQVLALSDPIPRERGCPGI
jgi:hypothetical protein